MPNFLRAQRPKILQDNIRRELEVSCVTTNSTSLALMPKAVIQIRCLKTDVAGSVALSIHIILFSGSKQCICGVI